MEKYHFGKPVIVADHLSKEFKHYSAIKELNFNVYEGEIFGFLGPSGAGKTTTIKMLTGQLQQTSGTAKILGIENTKVNEDIYKEVGIVSDMSGLYDRLTVYENLRFFAELFHVGKERIEELLTGFGLSEHRKKKASELSKGMRQRLIIARAILNRPKLLFLDEPTSGLDPMSALAVHKIISDLRDQGTTIFLTTHNMEEADKLCDRIAFLNEGTIADLASPADLKLKYTKSKEYKLTFSDGATKTVKQTPETIAQINEWMTNDQLAMIHSCEPTLEGIFLELTGRKLA